MPSVRTVLFDLDGTLIDTIELILASFQHTHQTHFGTDRDPALWIAGIGTPLRTQLGEVARSDAELEALLATFRAYNAEHHDRMARPYPGAVETVRALFQKGVPLGLVTSKVRAGARRSLRRLGLEDELPVRICADDVDRSKPDPEPVHRALEALGAAPETTVFVGDSPHDLLSGQRAGVQTAAASWGPFDSDALRRHQPTHWLQRIDQVLSLLPTGV